MAFLGLFDLIWAAYAKLVSGLSCSDFLPSDDAGDVLSLASQLSQCLRGGEGGGREIKTGHSREFLTFSTSFLSCEPGAKVSMGSLVIGGTRTAGEA